MKIPAVKLEDLKDLPQSCLSTSEKYCLEYRRMKRKAPGQERRFFFTFGPSRLPGIVLVGEFLRGCPSVLQATKRSNV